MNDLENDINQAMKDVLLASLEDLEFNENIVFSLNEPDNENVKKYIFKEELKKKLINSNKYQPMFLYGVNEISKDLFNEELATLKPTPENTEFGVIYEVQQKDEFSGTKILCTLDYFIANYVNERKTDDLEETPDGKKIIELDDLKFAFVEYLMSNNLVNANELNKAQDIIDSSINKEVGEIVSPKKMKI